MYLKSLSLNGFKSFGKKSQLKLEPGITVIVGPNGSGKSNISDAIQWVLGEQSPSSLRSALMQDVIFDNPLEDKGLGFAQVDLALDNSKGELPVEFNEVIVKRRMLRTGESDYFINNTHCRLLDVHDLLSDTGLGRQTYSIIGQGKLDEVVHSSPQERRALLEEAAGVSKHKKRKERALRKLISMENNLSRLKDILREINRQADPLKNQAEKLNRYRKLKEELKQTQITIEVNALLEAQKGLTALSNSEQELIEARNTINKELEQIESAIKELENAQEEDGSNLEALRSVEERLANINNSFQKVLLVLEEKRKSLSSRKADLKKQLEQNSAIKSQKDGQIKSLEKEQTEVDKEIGKLYERLSTARKESQALKSKSAEINKKIVSVEEILDQLNKVIEENRHRFIGSNSFVETALQKIGFFTKKIDELNLKEKAFLPQIEQLNEDEENKALKRFEKERLELEEKLTQAEHEAEEAQASKEKVEETLSKACHDLLWLKETKKSLFSNTEEALGKLRLNEVEPLGLIKDFIEVDKVYERAIEAVLRENLLGIVFSNVDDILNSLSVFKENKSRAVLSTFFKSSFAKRAQVEGTWALDVVRAKGKSKNLIESLLKNVVIIEDLKEIKRAKEGLSYVTLAGEIYTEGVLRIDYRNSQQGFLKIEEQIKSADKKESELKKELAQINQLIDEKILEKKQIQENLKENQKETSFYEKKLQEKLIKKENLNNQLKATIEEKNALANELNITKASLAKLEQKRSILEVEIEEQKKTLETKKSLLKDLRTKQEAFQKEESKFEQKLAGIQVELASKSEQGVYLKKELAQARFTLNSLKESLEKDSLKKRSINEFEQVFNPLTVVLTALGCQAQIKHEALGLESSQKNKNAKESQLQIKELADKKTNLYLELQKRSDTDQKIGVEKAELKLKKEEAEKKIELEFSLEAALAIEQFKDQTANAADIELLKAKIDEIGPINEIAAKEYEELAKRQDFFASQIEDVQKGKKSLNKVIRAIDKRMKEALVEAFHSVNENFQKMFASLFPAGQACIRLTDEDNLFETGVEIEAQPGGKNLKRLSLLSGGETALCALALLFAVYHARPCPFYVLDEVEAALDDINLERFMRLLRNMKNETQFIIITHQRRTMEVADCLYGVSMGPDGISKLVSQKLKKAEESLKELSVS